MNQQKRIIALLSAIMLIVSMIPIPTFAESSMKNVALGAQVIDGSNAEAEFPYENIVDGKIDNDSRLSSNVNTMPSVTLKLDNEEHIQFYRLYLEEREGDVRNNVKTYKITFSDNEDFIDSYSVERTIDNETIRDDVFMSESITANYVKIDVIETHGSDWDNAGLVEFELYKQPLNYALGSTVTGENAENDENTPDKAVDGSVDTRFSSSQDTVPTLEVDLGEEQDIQYFRLITEKRNLEPTNNLKEYTITFSNDADFSTELLSVERMMENDITIDASMLPESVTARYVKISDVATHGGSWDNVAIAEFELYDYPFEIAEIEGGAESIENVRPSYNSETNKIEVPHFEGYTIENNGADFEQIIDAAFNVQKPLTEKTVNISLKITEEATGEEMITEDYPIVIPGLYEESPGNDKPVVSPELAEWYSDSSDAFVADASSKIVVDSNDSDALERIANEFRVDFLEVTGKSLDISYGTNPRAGDFYFTLSSDDEFLGEEGYAIDITDKVVVSATNKTGAYWATRTILQILVQDEAKSAIPVGKIRDYPKYEVRGFLLDVARKPFSMEVLEDFAKNMAWFKMNDLQIHLSDNYIFLEDYGHGENELEAFKAYDAFRLESDYTNSEGESATAEDYAYSKEEFKNFILDNRELGFNIVPEIDIPAHANSFTKVFPEMMVEGLVSPLNSARPLIDHIDISKPEVVDMVKELFDDYTKGDNPTFDKETVVHIGADEFLSNYTAYRDFINEFVPYIKETNTVRMWGGLTWIKDNPITEIEQEAIENVQMNLWSSAWADGIEMYDMGYQVINTIDSYLYMVPNGSGGRGGYNDYLNTESIYNNFEPNLVGRSSGGWDYVPAGSDQMLGAVFAIWNDNIDKKSNGLTEVDMYKRFHDALPILAEKTWANGQEKGSVSNIQEVSKAVGYAPQSNPLLQLNSEGDVHANYAFKEGSEQADASENGHNLSDPVNATFTEGSGSQALTLHGKESYIETPLEKVGEGSELSFDVKLDKVNEGEVFFEYDSAYGTHDIRVMEDGKLGFTRELHDYTFDYVLPEGEWVNIKLKAESQNTSLYVNDDLIGSAKGKFIHNDMVKKEDIPHSTFALPIQRIGSKTNAITGQIDNVNIAVVTADDAGKISSDNITVEATTEYDGRGAENTIDGDASTFWHSDWADSSVTLPQELVFTFEKAEEIERMSYLPRQDQTDNGSVKMFDLYITGEDGEETKVIEGGTLVKDKLIKMIKFDPIVAKQVRFVVTESYGDTEDKFASAAEVSFFPIKEKEDPEVDLEALEKAVKEAKGKVESDYTAESWESLVEALRQAEEILAEQSATQEDIDEALMVLAEAIKGLKEESGQEPDPEPTPEVDLEALEKTVKEAKGKVESDYTAESWESLVEALRQAEEILAEQSATQEDIDEALMVLAEAIRGLKEEAGQEPDPEPTPEVDLEALEKTVKDAQTKVESDYTAESWESLVEALRQAKATLAEKDATQEQVDEVLAALRTAVDNLEEVAEGTNSEEGSKDNNEDNDNITIQPDDDKEGSELPKTATNTMNVMIVGFIIVLVGLFFWIRNIRNKSMS